MNLFNGGKRRPVKRRDSEEIKKNTGFLSISR